MYASDGGLNPNIFAPLALVAMAAAGYLWAWWSHRRFIRKYGPGPSEN